jgi:hypothetical protein
VDLVSIDSATSLIRPRLHTLAQTDGISFVSRVYIIMNHDLTA